MHRVRLAQKSVECIFMLTFHFYVLQCNGLAAFEIRKKISESYRLTSAPPYMMGRLRSCKPGLRAVLSSYSGSVPIVRSLQDDHARTMLQSGLLYV